MTPSHRFLLAIHVLFQTATVLIGASFLVKTWLFQRDATIFADCASKVITQINHFTAEDYHYIMTIGEILKKETKNLPSPDLVS